MKFELNLNREISA